MVIHAHLDCSGSETAGEVLRALDDARVERRRAARAISEPGQL